MSVTMSVHDAKAHLSDILRRAEQGEEIGITRHGHLVAMLVPPSQRFDRQPGLGKGTVEYLDDFDFTPSELEEMFDGPIEP
jgi:prevent-host-death family protein